MRICFLCQSLETLGGVQRAVVLLANELANRGEHIAVLMDGPNLNANPYGLSNRVQILEVEPTGKRSIISRCVSKVRQHTGFPRPRIHNGRFPESILTGEEFNLMRSRLADGISTSLLVAILCIRYLPFICVRDLRQRCAVGSIAPMMDIFARRAEAIMDSQNCIEMRLSTVPSTSF